MQASLDHSSQHHIFTSESEAKLIEDLKSSFRLNDDESSSPNAILEQHHHDEDDDVYVDANEHEHEHEDEDEDEDEEEFSFIFEGSNTSPIAAEDAFMNGQIKPSFPHFYGHEDDNEDGLPIKPQVNKVFVQLKDKDNQRSLMTSASSENDEISGPYCEWSSKKAATETSSPSSSAEACKKSNSTGFSKLWRFKEFRNRSNSDGRDAFVYLNNQPSTTSLSGNGEVKVNDGKVKVKKVVKTKATTLSPHEVYLINKAKEDDRRRSYLPYRQEVVGFFTNVNGGMSKNVHPF